MKFIIDNLGKEKFESIMQDNRAFNEFELLIKND